MKIEKKFNLLIVEDSSADQDMFSFLFENCPIAAEIHFASDGAQGSDFVFKREPYQAAPTPDLILMDLNLPIKNGRELLAEIRDDHHLCHIPVVMISTSTSPKDVKDAYCAGASAFISKSLDVDLFQQKINSLAEFWLKWAILPKHA